MNIENKVIPPSDPCDSLKKILLTVSPTKFEQLSKCIIQRLLGVPVRSARSGDQRGGDGGVSETGGRQLIFEARRYGDTTRLNEREIIGQINQAVERNPELEGWILVTTKEVSEQLRDAMTREEAKLGIGTVIFDWLEQPLPKFAVLSATYPECFKTVMSDGHDQLLHDIAAMQGYDATINTIRAELHTWAIGYESLRDASHNWIREMWQSRRIAGDRFRQNVAGGDEDAQHVRRKSLIHHLDRWLDVSETGQAGVMIGPEGVGKTWAVIDWLQLRLEQLPIIVIVPSSAITNRVSSRTDLIRFIVYCLHEIMSVRNMSFWEQRIHRLLKRPTKEGPTFILFFDGLNQCASFDWLGVFRQLQVDPFHQRILILMTVRTSYFDKRLDGCRTLVDKPHRIEVGNYDLAPGGEFEQKLALAGLSREDFPPHLINLAVVPRMFDLVIQLKDALGDVNEITAHRLLWAYGASVIFTSTDGAFSEGDWRQFILELAGDFRAGNHITTFRRVTELSNDATLTPDIIYNRVSSVIDSIFTNLKGDNSLNFQPDFVFHSLGLALINQLKGTKSVEEAKICLEKFLDPIEGYDEHAEILRAAVNVTLLKKIDPQPMWLSTLCTFWIHTQNLPGNHLEELAILAPELVNPLLDVVEASGGHTLRTPRNNAIYALNQVDKSDQSIARDFARRGTQWLSIISLEKRETDDEHAESSLYAMRRKRLNERIGTNSTGQVIVAGRHFKIVEYQDDDLIIAAAQLLQGRPSQ